MQDMRDLPVEKHPQPELDSDLKQKVKSNPFNLVVVELD